MAFTNWLRKMKEHSRKDLLYDLIDMLDEDVLAEAVEHIVTQLNDNGYDWDYAEEV